MDKNTISSFAWYRLERNPVLSTEYFLVLYNKNGLRSVKGRYKNVFKALDSLQRHVKFKERMNEIMSDVVAKLAADPLARAEVIRQAKERMKA